MLVRSSELKHNIIIVLFFSTLFLFAIPLFSSAQEHKKGETIFGLEAKGIIPSSILNAGEINLTNDSITVNIKPEYGYSFGMIIRHNFTKMFTLETGLHLTKRIFPVNFEHTNGIDELSNVEMISYEIPIQWLLYIQLGEQMYMNTILGVSLDIYPSDVTITKESYAYIIIPKSWIQTSLLASVGFEYRTKSSGYFYFGASIHTPFGDMGDFYLSYYHDNSQTEFVTLDTKLSGTYLSADFRYFFNKKKKKEKEVIY